MNPDEDGGGAKNCEQKFIYTPPNKICVIFRNALANESR